MSSSKHHGIDSRASTSIRWSKLREHWIALFLLITSLTIVLLAEGLQRFGPEWARFVEHTFETIAVVIFVHLLDHMWLVRGSMRLIDEAFQPLRRSAKSSLLRLARTSESFAAMQHCGMTRIYVSRSQAGRDIARDLMNSDALKIRVLGVSLNDFILDNSTPMQMAYQAIVDRLENPKQEAALGQTLDVRLLVIDPYSYGAQQRHKSEIQAANAPPGRLQHDVTTVVNG